MCHQKGFSCHGILSKKYKSHKWEWFIYFLKYTGFSETYLVFHTWKFAILAASQRARTPPLPFDKIGVNHTEGPNRGMAREKIEEKKRGSVLAENRERWVRARLTSSTAARGVPAMLTRSIHLVLLSAERKESLAELERTETTVILPVCEHKRSFVKFDLFFQSRNHSKTQFPQKKNAKACLFAQLWCFCLCQKPLAWSHSFGETIQCIKK